MFYPQYQGEVDWAQYIYMREFNWPFLTQSSPRNCIHLKFASLFNVNHQSFNHKDQHQKVVSNIAQANTAEIGLNYREKVPEYAHLTAYIFLYFTRSLGALRASTSGLRPFGPLDFVLRAIGRSGSVTHTSVIG